jgi:flagellar motor switch protein FliN/FliY
VNTEQALLSLAGTTAGAVREALSVLAPDEVEQRGTRVNSTASRALDGIDLPAVAVTAAYADGLDGGTLLLMPVAAAGGLVAASAGGSAPVVGGAPLSPTELEAIGEAMAGVMSAAAASAGVVLHRAVEVSPCETRLVMTEQELAETLTDEGQATSADVALFGVGCRFVHLVPPGFLLLVQDAFDVDPTDDISEPLRAAMLDVGVRVWAELGRARMSSHRAVALPRGAVVELDREAEDAIDLYVDGLHFATGRLVVTDEGELAVRLETVGSGVALGAVDKALT